jgi:hypothetical protein
MAPLENLDRARIEREVSVIEKQLRASNQSGRHTQKTHQGLAHRAIQHES